MASPLGWGGTYQTQRLQTIDARARFLKKVDQHAGQVLQSLAQEPLAAYQPLFFAASELGRKYELSSWDEFANTTREYSPLQFQVASTLREWGETFRLDEAWIYDCALSTLKSWCWAGIREPLQFSPPIEFEEIPFQEFDFHLTIKYADLKIRTLEEEKERFDEEYRVARDRYFNELIASIEQHWQKAEVPDEIERHLEWIVKYRINRFSVTKLAAEGHRSKTTIYDALRKMHKLLGLTPFQHPPGRRRGVATGRK